MRKPLHENFESPKKYLEDRKIAGINIVNIIILPIYRSNAVLIKTLKKILTDIEEQP